MLYNVIYSSSSSSEGPCSAAVNLATPAAAALLLLRRVGCGGSGPARTGAAGFQPTARPT